MNRLGISVPIGLLFGRGVEAARVVQIVIVVLALLTAELFVRVPDDLARAVGACLFHDGLLKFP